MCEMRELGSANQGCSSVQTQPGCFISADVEGGSRGQGWEGKHGPWTEMDCYLVRLVSHVNIREITRPYYVRVKGTFEIFEQF